MPLTLFRNQHVAELRRTVKANLDKYVEKKPWADRGSPSEKVKLRSSLEPSIPLELELPAGDDLKDFENSVRVHSALSGLTTLQARDPRLWTRLSHIECWGYMRARWDVARQGDEGKKERYILSRYFVPQSQSRALLRHGIARLWWYGHLTHDPSREQPYELTRWLLSFLDIAQQLLERNMGRSSAVRTGFLDFIRDKWDTLGSSQEQKRNSIRTLAKALNLRGGVTLLDSLDASDVAGMLEQEFESF